MYLGLKMFGVHHGLFSAFGVEPNGKNYCVCKFMSSLLVKLDIMIFLLLFASLGVAQTYFSVQNNYSLAHLRRAAHMECTLA